MGKGLTAGKVASNVQKKLTRAQEKVRAASRTCWRLGEIAFQASKRREASLSHHPLRRSVASRHHYNNSKAAVFGDVHFRYNLSLDTILQLTRPCCNEIQCIGPLLNTPVTDVSGALNPACIRNQTAKSVFLPHTLTKASHTRGYFILIYTRKQSCCYKNTVRGLWGSNTCTLR